MKRFPFLFITFSLLLAALSFSSCGDDDDVNPISFIGRPVGWSLESVTSNFQQQADAAIAAITDEEIAAAGRTRAEITETFNTIIARETNFDDCDRDDGLYFVDNGEVRVLQGDVICPEPGDPSVMASFDGNNYITNAAGTEMTIRFPGGTIQSRYNIPVLMDGLMELEQQRTVSDTLVGDVEYDINYRLLGNE
jgi:hypothetical protein